MFAVIAKYSVAILAYACASTSDDFLRHERRQMGVSGPHAAAIGELRERHFFDSSAEFPTRAPRIVHDLTLTDVDPMVHVSAPRRHKM
jgi:hypothetical protein